MIHIIVYLQRSELVKILALHCSTMGFTSHFAWHDIPNANINSLSIISIKIYNLRSVPGCCFCHFFTTLMKRNKPFNFNLSIDTYSVLHVHVPKETLRSGNKLHRVIIVKFTTLSLFPFGNTRDTLHTFNVVIRSI